MYSSYFSSPAECPPLNWILRFPELFLSVLIVLRLPLLQMIAQQRQGACWFLLLHQHALGAFRCVGAKFLYRAHAAVHQRGPGSSEAAAAGTVKNADLHLFRGRPAAARSPAGWAFRPRSNRSARSGVKGRHYIQPCILQIRNRDISASPRFPSPTSTARLRVP